MCTEAEGVRADGRTRVRVTWGCMRTESRERCWWGWHVCAIGAHGGAYSS